MFFQFHVKRVKHWCTLSRAVWHWVEVQMCHLYPAASEPGRRVMIKQLPKVPTRLGLASTLHTGNLGRHNLLTETYHDQALSI